MKSTEFLQAAIDVQAERGKQYDKPSGERSMAATVSAFNCITGSTLEESDGWMFLGLLKIVRQSQNPEKYHHDSALDFVAYASLYAEAASEQCGQLEAQKEQASDIASWDDAPVWAMWLAQDKYGQCWFKHKPEINHGNDSYRASEFGAKSTIKTIPGSKKSIRPKLFERPTTTTK